MDESDTTASRCALRAARRERAFCLAALLVLTAACDLPDKFPVYPGDITVGQFVKYPSNPVLAKGEEGAFDAKAVSSPSVLVDSGGALTMFYSALDAAGLRTIGAAGSSEGLVWNRLGDGPVITPTAGAFDEGGVADPSALYDGTQYWVFYTARDKDQKAAIGLASSGDGSSFDKASSPIFLPDDGAPDSGGATEPSAIYNDQEKRFYLYYTGYNQYGQGSIMLATSANGLDWEKYGAGSGFPQPVLGINADEQGFDLYSVEGPTVLATASPEGRVLYRMWYAGYKKDGSVHVGLAGSAAAEGQQAGVNWERYAGNPVMHYARSPSVVGYKDNLYMFYNELAPDASDGISLSTRFELTKK